MCRETVLVFTRTVIGGKSHFQQSRTHMLPKYPATASGKFGMCLETVAVFTRTVTGPKWHSQWYTDLKFYQVDLRITFPA